jgi:hypothetical protein
MLMAGSALWLLASAPQTHAAGPTTADVEDLIKKGSDLRRQGKDQLAITYYQRAYDISRTARTAAQLGLCEMQLGYFVAASDHIGEALAAPDDPWVEKYRSILQDCLRQASAHVASIAVTGSPAGAEVLVDGKVTGRLPLPAPLRLIAGGDRTIALHADGFEDHSEVVSARGGEQLRVVIHLAQSRPSTSASAVERAGAATSRSIDRPDNVSDRQPGSGLRVAAWSTAAGSLALLAAGTVELVVANHKVSEFERTPIEGNSDLSCGTDQSQFGGDDCARLHADWKRAQTLGLVGLVGGGLLAATSATLFVVSAGHGSQHRLSCLPGLATLGFSCVGRF